MLLEILRRCHFFTACSSERRAMARALCMLKKCHGILQYYRRSYHTDDNAVASLRYCDAVEFSTI